MKKWILILVAAFAVAACGGSKAAEKEQTVTEEPTTMPETAPENVLPNDGTRKVGDVTKCPVSGDVFLISDSAPTVEYEGGTYYFCCKGCVKDFEADPAKFLAGNAEGHHHGAAAQPDEAVQPDEGETPAE